MLQVEWWGLCIVGGSVAVVLYIVAVVLYRVAKLIEELEERVGEIEMDLLDVAYGGIPDRLRERTELIRAAEERRRAARGDPPDRLREMGYPLDSGSP